MKTVPLDDAVGSMLAYDITGLPDAGSPYCSSEKSLRFFPVHHRMSSRVTIS